MADNSQGASNRASGVSEDGARTRKDGRGDPRANTAPLAWLGQAGWSRFDHGFDGGCHDVSVIAVGHLGLGTKTGILTIRPW
jgi:hypothetical protein